jgi:hypothetical protein
VKALTLIVFIWPLLSFASASALTVDEIIKLKQAGVSDTTIEMLIERDGNARAAGTWKQNGWIIHSTEVREPRPLLDYSYNAPYPIDVYPQIYGGRHRRGKQPLPPAPMTP